MNSLNSSIDEGLYPEYSRSYEILLSNLVLRYGCEMGISKSKDDLGKEVYFKKRYKRVDSEKTVIEVHHMISKDQAFSTLHNQAGIVELEYLARPDYQLNFATYL